MFDRSGTGLLARRVLTICLLAALPAAAQSFRVQCPRSTITHPGANNDAEPAYNGPTPLTMGPGGFLVPSGPANGALKCQQISGGDGYATMADGTQTYLFSFGPLSGLADLANGKPGTQAPSIFNTPAAAPLVPGDPYTTGLANFGFNGAIGLATSTAYANTIYDISQAAGTSTVTVVLNAPSSFMLGDTVVINGTGVVGYDGSWTVTAVNVANPYFDANQAFQFVSNQTGLADVQASPTATAFSAPGIDGHVDPRQIMDVAVMNGNIPAPLMAIDEDDEFFLTLSNVGMIMRPDLFEQHTVHFHGYPNASAFYDGVPDASVAINIAASFSYYYLAPDAGTYFWHCHITPPEHLQMGMVGQLYVRPRQNRVPATTSLRTSLGWQQGDLRTACNPATDLFCSNSLPPVDNGATQGTDINSNPQKYAYNDGDGSTRYDVEYPLQMHGFDPNFHFVGMTFLDEGFSDLKDKYFLLNGRSYPDTVNPNPLATPASEGTYHYSQPLSSIVNIPAGGRALLRISNLSVSEYHTLASLGIPMHVIGINAKLLRDQAGVNLAYDTNSITLGGGESLDVILDASDKSRFPSGSVFYLYTPQLDHLSNDAENFGGLMTEVRIN
jgi:FtsP/CotA-like multicopper oxidase with cupredoxin domain